MNSAKKKNINSNNSFLLVFGFDNRKMILCSPRMEISPEYELLKYSKTNFILYLTISLSMILTPLIRISTVPALNIRLTAGISDYRDMFLVFFQTDNILNIYDKVQVALRP